MASNQIANALHAGGLLLLRDPDNGGPLICSGTAWGLKSIEFQESPSPLAQPDCWLVELEQPLSLSSPPFPADEVTEVQAQGFVICTPQTGPTQSNLNPPVIVAGVVPPQNAYGWGGKIRIYAQVPNHPPPQQWIRNPGYVGLLVMRAPTG